MNRKHFLTGVSVFIFTIFSAQSQVSLGTTDKEQLLAALREGGHVIYFRHAEKGQASDIAPRLPEKFESCLFPKVLLTEAGLSSMNSLGEQFERLNIPVGQVISSPVCRCIESAWFSFGEAILDSSLNGVYERDSSGRYIINNAVTEELAINLRRILVEVPVENSNTLLFAHSSNILALTGLQLQQGEAAIFKPDGQGHFTYVSRMNLDEWRRLVAQ